nr:hypothetical protein [Gammaproteobacteria bacterium]
MKNLTIIASALTLLLTGCAEESGNTGGTNSPATPAPVAPATNPDAQNPPTSTPTNPATNPTTQFPGTTFNPVPTTPDTGGSGEPDQDPVTGVPDPQEPTVPGPSTPVSGGNSVDPNLLINGSGIGDVDSAWRCEGETNTDPTRFFLLSFFADGTGQLQVGEEIAITRWTLADNQIQLREAVPYSVLIYNFEFFGRTEFYADLLVVDAGVAPIVCNLIDYNGNPVVDDDPVTGPVAPTPTPDPGAPTGGDITNGQTLATLNTLWLCEVSGAPILLGFAADGNGVYADEDYPDGVALTWSAG